MLQVASTSNTASHHNSPLLLCCGSVAQFQAAILLDIMYYLCCLLFIGWANIKMRCASFIFHDICPFLNNPPSLKDIQAKSYACACLAVALALLYCRKHTFRFLLAVGLSLLTTLLLLLHARGSSASILCWILFPMVLALLLLSYSVGCVHCNITFSHCLHLCAEPCCTVLHCL